MPEGFAEDDEQFYVVDEDRSTVVAGPFGDQDDARDEASDRGVGHIVATEGVLEMMALTSTATIRWETDDDGPDIVTDGMGPVGPSGGANNPKPTKGMDESDTLASAVSDHPPGKPHHCAICDTYHGTIAGLIKHECRNGGGDADAD